MLTVQFAVVTSSSPIGTCSSRPSRLREQQILPQDAASCVIRRIIAVMASGIGDATTDEFVVELTRGDDGDPQLCDLARGFIVTGRESARFLCSRAVLGMR